MDLLNPSVLGYDTTFELDDFSRPRLRSEAELIKNLVLYIFFSEPGNYPSLPNIGLRIQDRLYSFYDELNEDDLKNELTQQCSALGYYLKNGTIHIRKVKYRGKPSLMIHIDTSSEDYNIRSYKDQIDNNEDQFQIGITFNELNQMIYNISGGGRIEDYGSN